MNYNGGSETRVVRLVQITDTHLYADPYGEFDGVGTLASLQAVLDLARQRHATADAYLATGDLAHEGEAGAYALLRECLGGIGAPVYCIPGNHDDPRTMAASLAGGNVHMREAVDLGGWRVVLLNTHLPGSPAGCVGRARLAALEAALTQRPVAHVLIAMHHPPLPIGSPLMDGMMLEDAAEFFDLIDRFRCVRAVICGHVHQQFETTRNDVHVLAAPSTCVQFKPGMARYEQDTLSAGYRWLDLLPSGGVRTGIVRLES